GGERRREKICGGNDAADVVDAHRAAHEILDEQTFPVGAESDSLRRATGLFDGRDAYTRVGVENVDGIGALHGDEDVIAELTESRSEGHVAVVEVDAGGEVFGVGGEIDLRD